MKKIRNKIDGLLLLDKPTGISSNHALQQVKRWLNAAKAGHTGTLDPLASGLLPLCLGEATKFARYLLEGNKEYLATMQLGVITDSGDSDGQVLSVNPVTTDQTAILAALHQFTGKISQLPPMYSALKFAGRPLYEYARAGQVIERTARQVMIHRLQLIEYNQSLHQVTFQALVSKGTYIRTLAEDIGQQLGCGASLTALRRLTTNDFSLAHAISLDSLTANPSDISQVAEYLHPVSALTKHLPCLQVDEQQFSKLRFGNPVQLVNEISNGEANLLVQLFANQEFLGVATIVRDTANLCWLKPERLLNDLASLTPF
jgi:tRNA pseudouridine55 synthase